LDLAGGRAEWLPGPLLGRRLRNCSRPYRPRRHHRPDWRDSRPPRRTAGWHRTCSGAVRDLSPGFRQGAGSTKFAVVRWGHRQAEPDRECPDREASASRVGSAAWAAADRRAWHRPRLGWSRECRTARALLPVEAGCPVPRGSYVPVPQLQAPRLRRYRACPSRRATARYPVEGSGSLACRPGLPDLAFPPLRLQAWTAWVLRSDSSSAPLWCWDPRGWSRPSCQGTFSTGSESTRSTDFDKVCR